MSGHIDGTGTIRELKREGNAVWVTIDCSPKILRYIIEKGSIAIDGISLTVAYVDDTCFKVSIIPHTAWLESMLRNCLCHTKVTIQMKSFQMEMLQIDQDLI